MIYLKSKNLIFLKPRKVAGTSIEIMLSVYSQPEDILTPLTAKDEALRWHIAKKKPQNYQSTLQDIIKNPIQALRYVGNFKYPRKFFNHIDAEAVQKILESEWGNCEKISVIRNPYDRIISKYRYQVSTKKTSFSFADWVRAHCNALNENKSQYFIGEEMIINRFIRFESLQSDIAQLEHDYPSSLPGLSQLTSKVKAKSAAESSGTLRDDYLGKDSALREIIFNRCRWEFDFFGYDPEGGRADEKN